MLWISDSGSSKGEGKRLLLGRSGNLLPPSPLKERKKRNEAAHGSARSPSGAKRGKKAAPRGLSLRPYWGKKKKKERTFVLGSERPRERWAPLAGPWFCTKRGEGGGVSAGRGKKNRKEWGRWNES